MSQPRISQAVTWGKYRSDIFLVIQEALVILQSRPNLPSVEANQKKHSLNRELRKCFREAAFKCRLYNHSPTYEGKNPPSEFDIEPHERETKVPDFYWHLVDDVSGDERHFVLECKRLGYPSSPPWKLNENYVRNGIRRFISSPHEYGKDDAAAGMIGYVQSMELDDILQEVNRIADSNPEPISLLQLSPDGWQKKGVSELVHDLERPFPISPLRMYHFWVDIRKDE